MTESKPLIPGSIYPAMKWVVLILLPAFVVFYTSLAGIWNLPYVNEVTLVVAALTAFMGTFLQISTVQFNRIYHMTSTGLPFGDNFYDTMRWVTAVFVPALATFYLAIAPVFNFPFPQAVSATLMAFAVFLGSLLQISNALYVRAVKLRAEAFVEAMDPREQYKRMRPGSK